MSVTPQLLVGLETAEAALLLTAFGVGAEPDASILEPLPEARRAPLVRRARALLGVAREARVRFAVTELRRRLDGDEPGPAGALARLAARLERRDEALRG